MRNYYLRNYKIGVIPALLTILTCTVLSCSKVDDYKKFIKDGEISYTGKIDSLKIWSGKNRVLIKGLFLADPKVTRCKIFWNNKSDSISIQIERKNVVDTLNVFVENIAEGVQNFVIYTYDSFGNKSIPVYKTGRTYGERYQSSLTNRPISSAITAENGVTQIDWQGMDRLTGVFATDVSYTNNKSQVMTIRVPIDSIHTILTDFKQKTAISYHTLFLPDTMSIDTFYSSTTEMTVLKFEKKDITNLYLKNVGSPINYKSWDGYRWGVLADWTSSSSVMNTSDGNGGFEMRGGVGVISIEAGWGLPAVPNGLIYQTIMLPAGKYSFELNGLDQNSGGFRYIAVAEGRKLPDVTKIPSESIAFSAIDSKVLDFELSKETVVSIGFAVSVDDSGQYIKINNVRLYSKTYL